MKIAFIGTHGTGKTTLAYTTTGELKRIGRNATMVTEVARKCPLPINEKGSLNSQLWILSTQIAEELEAKHKFSHVVCDRSVLDTESYGIYSSVNNEMLTRLVDHWIGTYDLLFHVPVSYEMVDDGFRSTNKDFQCKVDQIISNLIQKRNLTCLKLPKENQIEFIMQQIHELEQKGQQKLSF